LRFEDLVERAISRRTALKVGGAAVVASQAAMLQNLVRTPVRPALAASGFSDIQFDLQNVHAAATFQDGGPAPVRAQFGVTFTLLVPARLTRNPTVADQARLANALNTIEANFSNTPGGLYIAAVAYGLPYFNRLSQSVVAAHMPKTLSGAPVLQEAVAGPTDVVNGRVQGAQNPIAKERFMVNVAIETNDMLFELRSDNLFNLGEVVAWVEGSNFLNGRFVPSPNFQGLINFQTPRLQFVQPGLPRAVADAAAQQDPAVAEFHARINPNSSMAMGFVDQAVDSSAPSADVVTFVGHLRHSNIPQLTTARVGDYFDNGTIAHFSHDIDDLYQFYQTAAQDPTGGGGEPFTERVQYMFRSNQSTGTNDRGLPSAGNADQFANGGGPAFLNNVFEGPGSARLAAQDAGGAAVGRSTDPTKTFNGQPRIGHESALQQTSRAPDGTPLHIRNDGPGFDGMDVPAFETFPGQPTLSTHFPAGTNQFKLQFLIFVPTSEFFRQLRESAGAQPLFAEFGQPKVPTGVQFADNGLERFITATRRQNFLVPPRRHRSFPLLELS
jgi:hypothetical protein